MGYFGGNGGYLKRKQPKNLWLDVGCLKKRNFAKVSERYFLTTVFSRSSRHFTDRAIFMTN
ncbi:TPA: hypothetical protein ACK4UE_000924 [Neisseria gonorrhoeae]